MPDNKLATFDPTAAATLTRPEFLQGADATGTEGITREELRLPRLSIAQGLSNQMMPDDSKYIEGLKLYDLFNDLTAEDYGRGPLHFVPVQRDVRRIEFTPRSQGGGIVDMDVSADDPRMEWSEDPNTHERIPPKATKFTEFVVLLLRKDRAPEPIMLSITSTNKFARAAAERLTTFIMLPQPPVPIYGGIYTIESKSEKNDKGTFGVPVIKKIGFVQSKDLLDFAARFHQQLKGKMIVVEREPEPDAEFAYGANANSEGPASQM